MTEADTFICLCHRTTSKPAQFLVRLFRNRCRCYLLLYTTQTRQWQGVQIEVAPNLQATQKLLSLPSRPPKRKITRPRFRPRALRPLRTSSQATSAHSSGRQQSPFQATFRRASRCCLESTKRNKKTVRREARVTPPAILVLYAGLLTVIAQHPTEFTIVFVGWFWHNVLRTL